MINSQYARYKICWIISVAVPAFHKNINFMYNSNLKIFFVLNIFTCDINFYFQISNNYRGKTLLCKHSCVYKIHDCMMNKFACIGGEYYLSVWFPCDVNIFGSVRLPSSLIIPHGLQVFCVTRRFAILALWKYHIFSKINYNSWLDTIRY